MAKSIKQFIFDIRADLRKSVKMELLAVILLVAGVMVWYWAYTPANLIRLSLIFGQENLVLITNIMSILIFVLLAGAFALFAMDLLLHYLRGKQLDEIIHGLAAQQAQAEAPPPPPPPAQPVQKKPMRPPQQGQPQGKQGVQPPPQRDVSPQRRSIIQKKPPTR